MKDRENLIPPLIIECKNLGQLLYWTSKLFSKNDELLIDLTSETKDGGVVFYMEIHGLSSAINHPVILRILLHAYVSVYREYWSERERALEKLNKLIRPLRERGFNLRTRC